VGPVVASSFFAIIDTPWRFKTVRKLWTYNGLAVGNRRSNKKWLSRKGLLPYGNRLLKNMIMRAATSTRRDKWGNPFNTLYDYHLMKGSTPAAAKNSVARKIVAVMWGMWKNGNDYCPQLIFADK
jgi:transposase